MKKKIWVSILVIVLAAVVGCGIYIYSYMNKVKRTELPKDDKDLGISAEQAQESSKKGVINIAFFGLDARTKGEASRSDSIMVITIDKDNKKIKMSSVMRDCYVSIPGKNKDKINAAYAYGGPLLSIKTINTNFNLDIRDYVTVDFFGLEKLVNVVGGVQVNVTSAEAKVANDYIDELNNLNKNKVVHISGGNQLLNGRQAVAYCRIRYVGKDDFQRTERQRFVLNQVYQKIKEQGIAKLPGTIATILPYVETSLGNGDILSLAKDVASYNVSSMEQFRIPIDNGYTNQVISGMDVLVPNLPLNVQKLHEFIYGVESK